MRAADPGNDLLKEFQEEIEQARREIRALSSASSDQLRQIAMDDEVRRELRTRSDEQDVEIAQLKDRNTLLEDFTRVAAHDLQTPLMIISAFAERILVDTTSERQKDSVARVLAAVARMTRLLSDLFAYTKATSDDVVVDTIDIKGLAVETWNAFESAERDDKAVMDVHSIPLVSADHTRVNQLLHNIIGNSLKYARSDRALRVEVRGRNIRHEGKDFVEVTISDNGQGFHDGQASRIFKPFERLPGNEKIKGTGMGLAICKSVVERHGGTIGARGRPGEGCAFTFTLPAADNSAQKPIRALST